MVDRPLHDGAPAHWFGNYLASGFSREVAMASHAVDVASDALLEAMKMAYPLEATVRVVHYRGTFTGTVQGWDIDGVRIFVENTNTGKTSKWWAAHVERMNLDG